MNEKTDVRRKRRALDPAEVRKLYRATREVGTVFGLSPMDRVMRFTADHGLFRAPPFRVDRFVLFESRQGKDHPVYDPLVEYALT